MRKRGQVIIEYVLLLVCVVAVATILVNLVDMSGSGGMVVRYWKTVIERIGEDEDKNP